MAKPETLGYGGGEGDGGTDSEVRALHSGEQGCY